MAHPTLTREQRDSFWRNGYLVVEHVIDPHLLAALRDDCEGWVKESRGYDKPYGETIDGRPRFDLEAGHSAGKPALRRVNSPVEISEAYFRCMADSRMTDMIADLIGPNVKYHHSKINSKLPGAATEVKWHQDFPFTPHSNDDIVTALLFIDDVTNENGPLEIAPGTHKGEIYSLWRGDTFAAAVSDEVAAESRKKAVLCTGQAGSCCFMHTRPVHGSPPNRSASPRTLFIAVYTAEDAIPLSPNPVPSRFEGLIVRGEKTNHVRSIAFEMELPQKPAGASFFTQQEAAEARAYSF
jgi:ectoine hydroxylase-related dioxygenase (phytanoyl-CoA dioxygenase family)